MGACPSFLSKSPQHRKLSFLETRLDVFWHQGQSTPNLNWLRILANLRGIKRKSSLIATQIQFGLNCGHFITFAFDQIRAMLNRVCLLTPEYRFCCRVRVGADRPGGGGSDPHPGEPLRAGCLAARHAGPRSSAPAVRAQHHRRRGEMRAVIPAQFKIVFPAVWFDLCRISNSAWVFCHVVFETFFFPLNCAGFHKTHLCPWANSAGMTGTWDSFFANQQCSVSRIIYKCLPSCLLRVVLNS